LISNFFLLWSFSKHSSREISDWESIKEAWDDYKTGKINRNKLVKEAIKILGKTFIKKIIERVI